MHVIVAFHHPCLAGIEIYCTLLPFGTVIPQHFNEMFHTCFPGFRYTTTYMYICAYASPTLY